MQLPIPYQNKVTEKATLRKFTDYNLIEFFDFNRDTTTPQMKKHQADLKESLLATGTDALYLQALELKRPNKEVYYKLIDGQNRFIVCRDNNLPFNLNVLTLEDMSDEAIDTYITRLNSTSRNWGTQDFETKLTTSSLANKDIVYMEEFAINNSLSKIERNIIFLNRQSISYKAGMNFELSQEQKDKAEIIVEEFLRVKETFISNKVMLTRNYLKIFHQIEPKDYGKFTNAIIKSATKDRFSDVEILFKLQLNKIGETYGYRLGISKKALSQIALSKQLQF